MSSKTYDLKAVLQKLIAGESLTRQESENILHHIALGEASELQVAAFLMAFQMRPITGDELLGFRQAMFRHALKLDVEDLDVIDLCGTGGDGKDTFNISTAASIVVAASGYHVAKHGNTSVSSSCGSSDVLQHLGYEFTNDVNQLRKELEDNNFCYLHAPLFHPAMRHVGNVRRELRIRTFFNLLGPLLNPASPHKQITGVYRKEIIPLYREVFEHIGSEYAIVHAMDGYDEISLTGDFAVCTSRRNEVLPASTFISAPLSEKALYGGDNVQSAADIFVRIIKGEGTAAQNTVVCANAALAIQRYEIDSSLQDCFAKAQEVVSSGKAWRTLQRVCKI